MTNPGQREGQLLGNYQLIELLGQGHWASVYLGEHRHLHSQAALKVLHNPLAPGEVEGFLTEARTLARLRHPHIVRILDFGLQEDVPFLVMDYAPEGTLRMLHPKGTQLPLSTVVSYVKQVASALQYAHGQRLIHRDLKPENLLLGPEQQLWLADFGLAVVMQSGSSQSVQQTAGTLAYMAPEQFKGQPTPASDQYALGVIVYEWLCGEPPFSGSFSELAVQHTLAPPPSLTKKVPTLPTGVERVVLKALAKDPAQRFASVAAFALAFEEAGQVETSSGQTVFLPSSHSSGPSASAARHQLPAQLTPLIGREQEVAAICTLLRRPQVRLVTLSGTGGTGKTRLALQVATEVQADFPDGVFFVSLAPLSDPALVLSSIAQVLDVKESGARPLPDLLSAFLRDKRLLLYLDNFEHLLPAAPQVTDLLTTCPHLSILVTSRTVLHLPGEHVFPVPPLAVPDLKERPATAETLPAYAAVALFLQRAQAIKPSFQLTSTNARPLAEVCIRLEGLPLAIELAAARIPLLPPQALLARLSQRLQVLTSGPRTAPARQQTLRKTLQWSYDLLGPQEQALFRRLAVFAGGWTLEAAEALGQETAPVIPDVLNALASLLDHSLIQRREQEVEEPRFRMLQTLREYGLELLADTGELQATQMAHAHFYLRLSEQAEPELQGPNQALWVERLEQEHNNLRAALEWVLEDVADEQAAERRDIALRLSTALSQFWEIRSHYSEARTFLERALARSEEADVSLRVKVLQACANAAFQQGDYARAEALAEPCLVLYREQGNTHGIADCLGLLVDLAVRRGVLTEAITLAEERVRLMQQMGEPGEVAATLSSLAEILNRRGEMARVQSLYDEAQMLYRKAGNDLGVALALLMSATGLWWFSQGDTATIQTIRHRLQEAQTIFSKLGSRYWIGVCFWLGALVALSEGETDRADRLVQEYLAIVRESGRRWSIAWGLHTRGRIEAQRRDLIAARNWYQQSLALTLEMGDKYITPHNLEGLAAVLAAQGELTGAAQLWGAAETLHEETGAPLPPVDHASYERAVATARAQLGEQALAAAWAAGRKMTPEQASVVPHQVSLSEPVPEALHPPSPTSVNDLTAREMEVLRLLARGLSNAQIAEELVVSLLTVKAHLRSIYSKLGVTSRSAATRYALEHHLS